MTPHNT